MFLMDISNDSKMLTIKFVLVCMYLSGRGREIVQNVKEVISQWKKIICGLILFSLNFLNFKSFLPWKFISIKISKIIKTKYKIGPESIIHALFYKYRLFSTLTYLYMIFFKCFHKNWKKNEKPSENDVSLLPPNHE